MTTQEKLLGIQLVKEHFGDAASSIVALIVQRTTCDLVTLMTELKLDHKLVAQILSNLILHKCVDYRVNSRDTVEYTFSSRNTLNRLKIPLFLHIIKSQFDAEALLIVEEMLVHGSLEMSSLLLRCMYRHRAAASSGGGDIADLTPQYVNSVYESFAKAFQRLVEAHYLARCLQVDAAAEKSKVPKFQSDWQHMAYLVPSLEAASLNDDRKLKACTEDVAACLIGKPSDENFGDAGVYWQLNESRFFQELRDREIINAVANKVDKNAAKVIQTVLQEVNHEMAGEQATRNTIRSKIILSRDVSKPLKNQIEPDLIEKYLQVLIKDSTFNCLEKADDFGGGSYFVDFKKASYSLCLGHIESFIREKYNSKSLRIFKVILAKLKLEHKQIEDASLVPAKDCKELIFRMLNDGILTINELSKTSDHVPSRTFYLFSVDIHNLAMKLLQELYKGIYNLMLKREHLNSENKRLLEKQQKINNQVELMKAQGLEESEIAEVQALMSVHDLLRLRSISEDCDKIELAEIQLTEAIFICEMFLYYHIVSPGS